MARNNKLVALIVVTLIAASCAYGKRPPTIISGQFFSLDHARLLKLGMTESEVRAQLGPPFQVSSGTGRTLWNYTVETTAKEDIKLLRLIPWPAKERGGKSSATLAFVDGILAEVQTLPR